MDLDAWGLSAEAAWRLAAFVAVFVLVALWEVVAPRRVPALARRQRWPANLGLVALNTVLLRLLFPLAGAGMAALAASRGWGLLNNFTVPPWLGGLLAVIALDLVIWLQHVMVHVVPALWRLHRVHHADPDFDLTTGARFHPLEMGLSMAIKFVAIVLIGAPVLAVVVFEVLLNATAMFNHGNIRLPGALERALRWVVVTPDMHRVHHSVEPDEANTNFGFNLPWWDHLFGTYRAQPRAGHQAMVIGLRGHTDLHEVAHLPGLLLLPFAAKP